MIFMPPRTSHIIKSNIKMKTTNQSIFDSKNQTIVNTVNCVGVMGKGIAKEFKARYPEMFGQYKNICDNKELKVGKPYLWRGNSQWVLNFPTKCHYKDKSQIEWIEDGLKYFKEHYKEWGITSIAFPALGYSNGGLDWNVVYPIIKKYLGEIKDIDIEIYPPHTTTIQNSHVQTVSNTDKYKRKITVPTKLDEFSLTNPQTTT